MKFSLMHVLWTFRRENLAILEYFLNWFSQHLPTEQADSIYDKFRLYQGLSEIPPEIDLQTDSDGQVRAGMD